MSVTIVVGMTTSIGIVARIPELRHSGARRNPCSVESVAFLRQLENASAY